MKKSWWTMGCLMAALVWFVGAGCASGSYAESQPSQARSAQPSQGSPHGGAVSEEPESFDGETVPMTTASEPMSRRERRRAERQGAAPGRQDSVVEESATDGGGRADELEAVDTDERRELPDRPARLMVYSGTVILAIFDVVRTQEKAIESVEEMGGYVSQRTANSLVLRVPAARFREALEELGTLGDVLDQRWDAQDVTDQVRDLDIRLRNALELRDRLEILLDRAETVEEALRIEQELERVTLEVERIRGQLQSFEDRIAYSTLVVEFRARVEHEVPEDEYLLPFGWLNQLGLESLYRSVEGRR